MPEWFEGLDAPLLEHVTAKGWNKPAGEVISALAVAHHEAQKFIGSDPASLIRLPKDATDPSYQGLYDKVVSLAVPPDPNGYKFDDVRFKDGTAIREEDAAFFRDVAAKNKMTPAQARNLAAAWAERRDNEAAGSAGNALAAKQANDTALRVRWSSDYDQKAFSASKAIDALQAMGVKVSLDGLDTAGYIAAHDGLVALGAQLNEATIHRGGGIVSNPTNGMTPEAARARFDELKQNREWVGKALTTGTDENTLYQNLLKVMAGPR